MTLGLGGDYPAGYELRALESGTYYLKVYSTANPSPTFPLSYAIGVAFDRRTGPTTKCTLAVGQKVRGYYNWTFDEDWRRIAAEPGKRYTVLLGSPLGARGAGAGQAGQGARKLRQLGVPAQSLRQLHRELRRPLLRARQVGR